jgi:DNA-binding transcriptional LysR family regulator
MDRWREYELFVQMAESGSLTRAAELLDIPIATASRGLAALEKRLGVSLVERNARSLMLTDLGRDFHIRCKAVLAEVKDAEANIHAATVDPGGTLRVTGSASFCLTHVAPMLPEFTLRYPKVNVQVIAANRYYNLLDSGIDVSFRVGREEVDPNITVIPLAQAQYLMAASPAYIARRGAPRTLAELARREMLVYSYAQNPHDLRFSRDGQNISVKISSLLESNDGQVLRRCGLLGMGIVVQPNYVIHEDLCAGRLVPLLGEWQLPRVPVNMAYQGRRQIAGKTRAFVDFVVEHFRKLDLDREWKRPFEAQAVEALRPAFAAQSAATGVLHGV